MRSRHAIIGGNMEYVMSLTIAKISVPRVDATKSLAHNMALALCAEYGLTAAAKAIGKGVWGIAVDQAVAIQAEAHELNDRKARLDAFFNEVKAEARSAALLDIAHQLGLDRFTVGNEKAKEKKDNSAVMLVRALAKLDNYASRINGAWELDVLLVPGISTGKLEDAKKDVRKAADAAKEQAEGVPVHVALKREGASLADVAALAAADGSTLTAEGMAVAQRMIHGCNALIVQMLRGFIQPEQIAELADMAELAIESSASGEGEETTDVTLADIDGETEQETAEPMQAQG